MGVLNVTPDSFYDGGCHVGERAEAHLRSLVAAGAFVIDIGGEPTRPGAAAVTAREQLERIEPAVKAAVSLAQRSGRLWISIDTADPEVAERALGWGAHIINDVSCLAQTDLARVVSRAAATLIIMHARGKMADMAGFSRYPDHGYADVVDDVIREWNAARELAVQAGVPAQDILFDPGIGFAKNAQHSLEILRRVAHFSVLATPIVLGPSRKSFLNHVEQVPAEQRLGGTVAACLYAAEHGAMLLRVHDVQVVRQALMTRRVLGSSSNAEGPC